MKTGLVLEGGGLRGIFSAGVLDVLMEEGVKFDGAAGVSAGAAFGSNYKSGQNRRAIRYNLRFAKDPRYSSVMSLIATGNLFNAQFCYHDIPEKLDPFDWEAFRRNPMEFYLVCTDVETGKPVYHLCDNDSEQEMLEWFRASGSMPMVSRVVELGGYKLLDGGISDSIPLRFMEEQGYERNVVILTRPAGYAKHSSKMMGVMSRALKDYPETVKALENRHVMYNQEVAYVRKREAGKYALVIRPDSEIDVGRVEHDRIKIREAYKAGRKAARRRLPEIRRFLAGAKKEAAELPGVRASIIEVSPEERLAAERAEGERISAEKSLAERIAAEKAEAERIAAQKAAAEKAEAERIAAEKAEAERIAAEKAEAERLAAEKAEAERLAAEKAAAEKAEAERIAAAAARTAAMVQRTNGLGTLNGRIPVRGRKHRRNWKPGDMKALKQREQDSEEN